MAVQPPKQSILNFNAAYHVKRQIYLMTDVRVYDILWINQLQTKHTVFIFVNLSISCHTRTITHIVCCRRRLSQKNEDLLDTQNPIIVPLYAVYVGTMYSACRLLIFARYSEIRISLFTSLLCNVLLLLLLL
jgi:hypothetical protein